MEKGTLHIITCYYIKHIILYNYYIAELLDYTQLWGLTLTFTGQILSFPHLSSEHTNDRYSSSRAGDLDIYASTQRLQNVSVHTMLYATFVKHPYIF